MKDQTAMLIVRKLDPDQLQWNCNAVLYKMCKEEKARTVYKHLFILFQKSPQLLNKYPFWYKYELLSLHYNNVTLTFKTVW